MKLHRKAFTLIELMIAISIFSIIMLFLYKTYADLNVSNNNLRVEFKKIEKIENVKKVIFKDYALALPNSIKIDNREINEDFINLQTTHSIHRRYNPYVTYIVKNDKLYRLESLKKFLNYDLPNDAEFDVDLLGEVKNFRVYKENNNKEAYLVSLIFKNDQNILMKINVLNEY